MLNLNRQAVSIVAPPVGAWIETLDKAELFLGTKVAPPVGAWIETRLTAKANGQNLSRPPWARGLKRNRCHNLSLDSVAPPVGAWIETFFNSYLVDK